ncbi:hypothetical protein [Virgibacillus kimchii]
MEFSFYLILLTVGFLSIFIIGKMIYHRKKFTNMTAMMAAMSIGMSVGLTMGVIFGISISDNYLMATILGIMVGLSIGFLAGLPISAVAVLDGMLAGLMGGMMGAMLGEMMAPANYESIINIMFFLFLTTILLILYVIDQEINNKKMPFYTNPLFTILLFGVTFILLNQLGPLLPDTAPLHNHDHH